MHVEPSATNTAACLRAVGVVVFDLDDTLFPERQYVQSGFRAVSAFLQQQGVVSQDVFPAMWRRFVAGERTAVFNRVLEECGAEPRRDLVDKLVLLYRTHPPDIRLYPDALSVLEYFHARKKLALLSDGYAQAQAAKISALGIERYFSAIVLTDQMGRDFWKPSPAGFKNIMADLGGDPAEYVYIGDNPNKDFAAPRMLGWQTVCVRRPEGVYAQAAAPDRSFEALYLVGDLYQAARLLDPDFTAQSA